MHTPLVDPGPADYEWIRPLYQILAHDELWQRLHDHGRATQLRDACIETAPGTAKLDVHIWPMSFWVQTVRTLEGESEPD